MSILQEAKYRAKTIAYAERYGVAKAAANYHTSEKNIYRWRKILKENGGNILSLENKSRRPKSHPVTVSIMLIHQAYSYVKWFQLLKCLE